MKTISGQASEGEGRTVSSSKLYRTTNSFRNVYPDWRRRWCVLERKTFIPERRIASAIRSFLHGRCQRTMRCSIEKKRTRDTLKNEGRTWWRIYWWTLYSRVRHAFGYTAANVIPCKRRYTRRKISTNDDVIKAATIISWLGMWYAVVATLTRVNINIYLLLLSNKTCYARWGPEQERNIANIILRVGLRVSLVEPRTRSTHALSLISRRWFSRHALSLPSKLPHRL